MTHGVMPCSLTFFRDLTVLEEALEKFVCVRNGPAGIFRDSHIVAFLQKVMVVRGVLVLAHWRVPLVGVELRYDGPGTQLSGQYYKYLISASTNSESLEDYISQADAARIRGVSNQAIADLIRRGRLTPVKVAGRILVLRSEVEAFVAQPKLGRPPKKSTSKKAKPKK